MPDLEFWSQDRQFGLKIPRQILQAILTWCNEAGNDETGGILIGEYTPLHDCALVHQATGPTKDSAASPTRFRRGVGGLNTLVDRLWKRERRYYLGEWHFHPGAPPEPSGIDDTQLAEIAADTRYRCPEPVLLLVGGDPTDKWGMAAFVFKHGIRKSMPRATAEDPLSG